VDTRNSRKYEHLGLLDVGTRQNWFFSRFLFPDPQALNAGRMSLTPPTSRWSALLPPRSHHR
jgi:hypothetical protein